MRNVLILGAYSAIAQETARCFAKVGDALFLVGRDSEKLEILSRDLKIRGAAKADFFSSDLNDFTQHAVILKKAQEFLGNLDTVLIAHGVLPDQKKTQESYEEAEYALRVNFLSVVSLLIPLAQEFEKKRQGTLAVIASVAGDRGRSKVYTYSAAKGALAIYLEGLRARLAKSNVTVVTIKPGYVHTPMTANIKKNFLFASAETVGRGIYRAIAQKKDTVYLPGFWCFIMAIIKIIPERIFKKMSI